MKVTDGKDIPNSVCYKCRKQTVCTCKSFYVVNTQEDWGMTAQDWEEQRKLANEGLADYARLLREEDR